MGIRLLESAKEDLRDGYWFYEDQCVGLGTYFLDCLEVDIRSLETYAGIHETADGFLRMLAKRFPFVVYYLLSDSSVHIYAILDCRRDPEWHHARLRERRISR